MFGWIPSIITFFIKEHKEDRRRELLDSKEWLETNQHELERLAKDAYQFILPNSAEKIIEQNLGSRHPFVEKLNTFPERGNAFIEQYQKLDWKSRQRAWRKCKEYVDLWEVYIEELPKNAEIPYSHRGFVKVHRIFCLAMQNPRPST